MQGWNLTIVETTKNYIFGGFTTAEWESPSSTPYIKKPCPYSFLFSVNEGRKYPITNRDIDAIRCYSCYSAWFGRGELRINSDSNNNTGSFCYANGYSYRLPAAKGSEYPSMNGGK